MQNNKKLIWDVPTRLFHWGIVITLCYSWYSMDILGNLDHHFISGYVALGLIVFRIIWGFIGSRYARFGSFMYKPSETAGYAKTFFKREKGKYAGHNPMGGLSVFALLIVILVQVGTGLFADDEYYYFAPLNQFITSSMAGTITGIHGLTAKFILGLAIMHIVAIFFYRWYKKEKLIVPMITGKKVDEEDNYEAIPGSKMPLAIVIAIIVAAAVYYVANHV